MPETNEMRRARKLLDRINRAHDWRVKVWAQCELRIQAMSTELTVLGNEPPMLFKPDFSDHDMLLEYAAEKGTPRAASK